ncbi:MAG: RnfABCDGE type electron transport complex subunit D [bacterium]
MSKYVVSLSPHEKGTYTVKKVMLGVIIALFPSFAASIYFYGIRAVIVTAVAMLSCMGTEFLIKKFMLKEDSTLDGSAALTGILLAFNLPSSIPLWEVVLGSVFAIAIAKMAFGGLGKNPFNPALAGRAFMLASFPVDMTTWPLPVKTSLLWNIPVTDATTGATPLGLLKQGALDFQAIDYFDLFIGNMGGCIGEVSALAIILGGVFMLYKKIITWHIPVFYLLTVFVFTGIFWWINPETNADPLFHILTGGVMLGAWFMATDMVTSPMSIKGQIVFAIGGGIICSSIRLFGGYPEGCSYSILVMNAFVPLIDKYIKPSKFGKEVNYG